ncbi:MAG TPA: hypothetical protein VGZ29_10070 [Terriglobia bacterium]|nr:hypothetical protein [Terriglobia bacterium]
MKLFRMLGSTAIVALALAGFASAQTWTTLTNQPGANVGPMLQLRDGRILVNESQSPDPGNWYILTPDSTGSYVNGTWSSGGTMQSGYQPIYFGSQVLLNGTQVAIEGGEYNQGSPVWTTQGSIGTVTPWGSISWASNNPPAGWTSIGDAESVILPNGKYMQANCCTGQNAIFSAANSWTTTGSVHQSSNDESGFTLLPNGKVLTVDTKSAGSCGSSKATELYSPLTGVWSCGPATPVQLYNSFDEELGAAVLMYNKKVIQFGGNVVATALYDVVSNTWSSGPTPTNGLDQADGPAALEPNGNVLAMLSPGLFGSGCQFVEYNPTTNSLANVANPSACPSDSSYVGHLMMLPSGQIMFTDFSGTVEVYTPAAGVVSGVAPSIRLPKTTLTSGSKNNVLYGKQLNGLSENNAYGDDYQGATNYPLVRLTATDGTVYYAFTHDDSAHSIAPNSQGTTRFDLPTLPSGSYTLVAVTNGIASNAISVTVQ